MRETYEEQNSTMENYIRMGYSYMMRMTYIIYALPAMFPLLYIIFGYPSPSIWITPLGLDEGYVNFADGEWKMNFFS